MYTLTYELENKPNSIWGIIRWQIQNTQNNVSIPILFFTLSQWCLLKNVDVIEIFTRNFGHWFLSMGSKKQTYHSSDE